MNPYHYRECGLDNIWLMNGYEIHETAYGKGVSFDRAEELDAAIAKALTEKPAPLTGKEFRFLRIMLDMSQKTVGELMGKEAQTVALWEKAEALKPDVDFLFRHIYRQIAINNSDSYRELVERLNHMDRRENDAQMMFKATETGWDKAA
ncbi:DNA-binding transcriptional regulator YiaG, contains XRE-type HTH domain [Methylomagnum ishizawai]|uniref:DNA-binding transcriptional regulator YiaG, contains XRE-type HTH domain n=1 Tax=Methylomagnum ishizawai TaxID=1760988 RepID=A0A1Y6D9C0_9GAMM|nr:hypothetical protein [Methylomagnum ishizawai]SMF96992.1 DNA-binding transcriptional regulator YiaG, contains XRE-type HTH domain [Methylomagnum ishizawai]